MYLNIMIVLNGREFYLDGYSSNAWIECDNQVLYNFGKINLKNKIRLFLDKQYILVSTNPSSNLYLVIKIPNEKEKYWEQIHFSTFRI